MVILQCPRPAAFRCVFIQDRVDVGKKYNLIDHTVFDVYLYSCELYVCLFYHAIIQKATYVN